MCGIRLDPTPPAWASLCRTCSHQCVQMPSDGTGREKAHTHLSFLIELSCPYFEFSFLDSCSREEQEPSVSYNLSNLSCIRPTPTPPCLYWSDPPTPTPDFPGLPYLREYRTQDPGGRLKTTSWALLPLKLLHIARIMVLPDWRGPFACAHPSPIRHKQEFSATKVKIY